MPHKADKSFFDKKKSWSDRKDTILADYLAAYLPKIATQRKRILLVDAFAGPGSFGDGAAGSPLIICRAISAAKISNPSLPASCIYIEKDTSLCDQLRKSLSTFSFASVRCGAFIDQIAELSEQAKTHNLFLYVDPFTVEGLAWDEMDRVFQLLSRTTSIELLLNLNVASLVRRGLGALALGIPDVNPQTEDAEEIDAPLPAPPNVAKLDLIMGGNWWQEIVRQSVPFDEQVRRVAQTFCAKLRQRFSEVCMHAVKAVPHHSVAKYYLVFASRHPDALRLMNDAMCKSRKTLAELAKPTHPTLFETRSEELVPDTSKIGPLVLKHSATKQSRGKVITAVIRDAFCDYNSKEIRGVIEQLLKAGALTSGTGKWRINDDVPIWKTEP